MPVSLFQRDTTVITDGAFGTYCQELTGDYGILPEWGNLSNPGLIQRIHREYLQAGADIIRTNTFSANPVTLKSNMAQTKAVIGAGIRCARTAVADFPGKGIAASIGPIPDTDRDGKALNADMILEYYRQIIDSIFDEGVDCFFFETFSSTEFLLPIAADIKQKHPEAFILALFALTPDGHTRKGIPCRSVFQEAFQGPVDAVGFNCGVGPGHMLHYLQDVDCTHRMVAALPNAGYPEILHERTVYTNTPDYFAAQLLRLRDMGARILGGCCGTTPEHIRLLSKGLMGSASNSPKWTSAAPRRKEVQHIEKPFAEVWKHKACPIAVEIDPPQDADLSRILDIAHTLKESGADILTVADSPLGRARMDSIMTAVRIQHGVGIEVLPHICCRDKNSIALRSALLAAYGEGVRSVLAVTGDPVPEAARGDVRNVFNLNSFSLIEFIQSMNQDVFSGDPMAVGAALNLNGRKPEGELDRLARKAQLGASFFLTQPIFDPQVLPWLKRTKEMRDVKVLGGILPLVSHRNAQFLNNEIPGIRIPPEVIARFHPDMDREAAEQTGLNIACELADFMKPFVDGFYLIMPFHRAELICRLVSHIRRGM